MTGGLPAARTGTAGVAAASSAAVRKVPVYFIQCVLRAGLIGLYGVGNGFEDVQTGHSIVLQLFGFVRRGISLKHQVGCN